MIYTHVAAGLLGLALGAAGAWQVQDWRHTAELAQQREDAAELQRLRARTVDSAAASHEATRAQLDAEFKVITREVERVVERPVYRNVCLDADGLRILGRAIASPGDPGQPAPALPGSDAAR